MIFKLPSAFLGPLDLIESLHHNKTLILFVRRSFRPLHPPYLDSMTSLHSPPLSEFRRQIHFLNKAKLNCLTLIIPSPPASLDLQTLSQATHAIFLPSDLQPHKKFLYRHTIFFNTVDGNLNKER